MSFIKARILAFLRGMLLIPTILAVMRESHRSLILAEMDGRYERYHCIRVGVRVYECERLCVRTVRVRLCVCVCVKVGTCACVHACTC